MSAINPQTDKRSLSRTSRVRLCISLLSLQMIGMLTVGCSTTNGFLVDRGRDAADVFTLSVGYGVGAKARVGPIQVGLFANSDVAGLRGGEMILPSSERYGTRETLDLDFLLPIPSSSSEWPNLTASIESCDLGSTASLRKSFFATGRYVPFFTHSDSGFYYTEIEVALGLGGTIRLGFNAGELLDFILGWLTIDIFGDDIGVIGRGLTGPRLHTSQYDK